MTWVRLLCMGWSGFLSEATLGVCVKVEAMKQSGLSEALVDHFMRCSVRYVVRKEVLIYAEKSELNPKCYFVRGILSLSLWVMGIILLVFQTKSRTALTTPCCAFLFSQFHCQWISD